MAPMIAPRLVFVVWLDKQQSNIMLIVLMHLFPPWHLMAKNCKMVLMHVSRRHRVGKALPERPLNSARVTAVERTLRDFPARPNGEVIGPEVGVTFDSTGEAYYFYNLHYWNGVSESDMEKKPAEC
jgi:hypothetical protein